MRDSVRLELDERQPGCGKILIKRPETKSLDVLKENAPQAMGFQAHIEKDLDLKSLR